jgi:Flp pilus assembly protein TadD
MASGVHFWVVQVVVVCLLATRAPAAQTQENYARAEALVRAGQFDEGITLLSRLLAGEPQNLQARNLLGIALTGKGELPEANREYRKALQIKPDFVPALKNLAINELTQNETAGATRHFTAAMKLVPHDPVVHAYLGKIAYALRDYQRAVSHLESSGELLQDPSVASELIDSDLHVGKPDKAREVVVRLEPDKLASEWQFRLGLVLAQHELFAEAIPFFKKASATDPATYDAGFDLAVCYVETRQFSLAIEVLKGIASRGHKTTELDNLLSEAYEGNNQTQEAIDSLREAVQLEPHDEGSYVRLAALCTKYEAYDLGLEVIQSGLQYHPQSDRLILQRGALYALENKFDLAEKDFQLASEIAPEKNLSYAVLGASYMQQGDFSKAVTSLRQQVREKPNDSTLQYLFGVALIRSGAEPATPDFKQAEAALEESVKLNPKTSAAQVELAKIYLKENRVDEAVKSLEQARALNPKDAAVYLELVVAYRHQRKPELADTALMTLNQLNQEAPKDATPRRRLRIVQEASPHGVR